MSTPILIMGSSGSGKSTSIKYLNPKETFIIQIDKKPLPFRGWKKMYKEVPDPLLNPETWYKEGNLYACPPEDMYAYAIRCLKGVNAKMPHIKNIIIDDFQYGMSLDYLDKATKNEKKNNWDLITKLQSSAVDLIRCPKYFNNHNLCVIFMAHSVIDEDGNVKPLTLGKFADEKIVLSGLFTYSLFMTILNKKYVVITKYMNNVKSGEVFSSDEISPDLQYIVNSIIEYENEEMEDIPQ